MDTNMVLRDGSADFTADESLTAVVVGPMTRPMTLCVMVPEVSAGGDTLDVELEFNDDGSTQIDNANMKQIAAAGMFTIPFYTNHKYLLVKLNGTDGGGAALDLGAVKVWIAPAGRYDAVGDS
jgi:hypothetical protein